MSPGFLFCAVIAHEAGCAPSPSIIYLLAVLTRLICRSTCIAAMDCFYINLGSAAERKLNIKRNFAAYKMPGWTLTRFSALDTAYFGRQNIAGTARPTEKASFLSH
jgi:hypothetical protein